jgi:hypothetical protein
MRIDGRNVVAAVYLLSLAVIVSFGVARFGSAPDFPAKASVIVLCVLIFIAVVVAVAWVQTIFEKKGERERTYVDFL